MKNVSLISILTLLTQVIISQNINVDVNLNVNHVLGEDSAFQREKFINIHSDVTTNYWYDNDLFTDDLINEFINGYDVYMGRNTGTISWSCNTVKEDKNRPGYANTLDLFNLGRNNRSKYASNSHWHAYEDRNNLNVCSQLWPLYPDKHQATKNGWYYPYADYIHNVSCNAMTMQFMERANNITQAMNYTMLKASWGTPTVDDVWTARLLRRENEPISLSGTWIYSDRVQYYQLWANVKGTRIEHDDTPIKHSKANELKIYPNPATDLLRIENKATKHYEIGIFNLQGNLLLSKLLTEQHSNIDVSSIAPGSYILRAIHGTEVNNLIFQIQ